MEEEKVPEKTADENPNPWYPDTYVQTVELADGETLKGHAALNTTTDDLWVWIDEEISMGRASVIFENPEKTEVIISHTTELDTLRFEGYTRLVTVKADAAGKISVRMNRP